MLAGLTGMGIRVALPIQAEFCCEGYVVAIKPIIQALLLTDMEHGPKKLTSDDPLESLDFSASMPPLPVPHEGVFALEVHAGGELIGMVRITVLQAADEIQEEGGENE